MLRIPDFTKPELEHIIEYANFTEQERILFDLRNDETPHERCAEILNVSPSTEYRINRRMIRKILKVI